MVATTGTAGTSPTPTASPPPSPTLTAAVSLPDGEQHQDPAGSLSPTGPEAEVHEAQEVDASGPASASGQEPGEEEPGVGDGEQEGSSTGREDTFAFKLLTPGHVAGCILGKGGHTITAIQTLTATKIKMSQANEYFPGTGERVVLITGEPDAVRKAVFEVLRRTAEGMRTTKQQSGPASKRAVTLFRALLPMSAAGLVIGRGGETVKALNATTGARVQLANKSQCPIATERICTVTGTMQAVMEVATFMLERLAEEPVISKYANPSTSYHEQLSAAAAAAAAGAGAPFPFHHPGGGPFPPHPHGHMLPPPQGGGGMLPHGHPQGGGGGGGGPFFVLPPPPHGGAWVAAPPPFAMRPNGGGGGGGPGGDVFFVPAGNGGGGTPPVFDGSGGMHAYGMNGGGNGGGNGGAPHAAAYHHAQHMAAMQQQVQAQGAANGGVPPPPHAALMVPSHGGGASRMFVPAAPGVTNISLRVVDNAGNARLDMSVPDAMVGAMLGREGSAIVDIQNATGTRVKVTQRGEYVVGTPNHRGVAITGALDGVLAAHAYVTHRLQAAAMGLDPTAAAVAAVQHAQQQQQAAQQQQQAAQQQAAAAMAAAAGGGMPQHMLSPTTQQAQQQGAVMYGGEGDGYWGDGSGNGGGMHNGWMQPGPGGSGGGGGGGGGGHPGQMMHQQSYGVMAPHA